MLFETEQAEYGNYLYVRFRDDEDGKNQFPHQIVFTHRANNFNFFFRYHIDILKMQKEKEPEEKPQIVERKN